jgi:IclR family transcriptional regulator, acetate operon repressor
MVAEDREGSQGGAHVAGAQTISRAFAVLRLFCDHRGDLGVGTISKELGLNLSTTHRIVRALVAEGYLAQNEDSERYYLGTGALLLGQAAHRTFSLDVVYPVLQRLAANTGESVNLGVLSGDVAVVVERIESREPLRFTQPPGTRVPLHASSMGKVLLAFNDEAEQRTLKGVTRLKRITPKTHVTAKALRSDLRRTRERGWSIDDEESTIGVRCVGAPICDRAGIAAAAIAVQAPAVRMPDERFEELGPEVTKAAQEVSALLPPGHSF